MTARPRLLIACRLTAYEVLASLLRDCIDALHAETLVQTLSLLDRRTDVNGVLASLAFEESRMFDLLRAVRARYPAMPLIVCRAPDTELARISLEGVRIAAESLGASAFLDLAALSETYSDYELKAKACELLLETIWRAAK